MPRKPRETPPANSWARWAWELRLHRGLTQEKFAEVTHLGRETIADWERGAAVPDGASIEKVGKAFHVPVPAPMSVGEPVAPYPSPKPLPGVAGLVAAVQAWASGVEPALLEDHEFFSELTRLYSAHKTRGKGHGPPISQAPHRRHGSSR